MKVIGTLFGLCLISGCNITPMTAELEPDTSVPASDIGNGQTVYLSVVDERTEQHIGYQGIGGSHDAKISLDEDLAAIVQSALSEMLQTKGFDIAYDESNTQKPLLRVAIRGLLYSTSMTGFWTGGEVQVTATLKATVNGELENYDNFYRYENVDRLLVVPGVDRNNEMINAALNGVLHQLVSDGKLLEILARR